MKKVFYPALLGTVALAVLFTACSPAVVSGPAQNTGTTTAVSEQKTSAQNNATAAPASLITPDTKPADTGTASQPASPSLVKISDVLQNHKTYDGKIIQVQGKIVNECGSGCWFTLKDGNAVIYIDLAPNNMVIPQKRGADAKVTAKVVSEGSDVYLIGSKVEF